MHKKMENGGEPDEGPEEQEEQVPDGWDYVDDEGRKKRIHPFRFGINYSRHPNLLPAFYGAVNSYFQKVMDAYIIGDGWFYDHMRKAATKHKMQDIFNCLGTRLGTKEEKDKHFEITMHVILEAAKFQWLAPWKQRLTLAHTTCMKRQVGGLFLTYAILKHQPLGPSVNGRIASPQKLMADSEDIWAIQVFFRDVNNISDQGNGAALRKEISKCYLKLYNEDLFEYSVFKDNYTSSPAVHFLKAVKEDETYCYLGKMKDMRDYLLYMTFQGVGNHCFKTLMKQARLLEIKWKKRNVGKGKQGMEKDCNGGSENTFPPERKKTWSVEDIEELSKERDLAVIAFRLIEILKYLTPPNPMTLPRLMGADNDLGDTEEKLAQDVESINKKEKQLYDSRKNYKMKRRRKDNGKETTSKVRRRSFDRLESRGFKKYLGRMYNKPNEDDRELDDELKKKLEAVKDVEVVSTYPEILFLTKEGKIVRKLRSVPPVQQVHRTLNFNSEEELLQCLKNIRDKSKKPKYADDKNILDDDEDDGDKENSGFTSDEGETLDNSFEQVEDMEVEEPQYKSDHEEESDVLSNSGSRSSTHSKWIEISKTESLCFSTNGKLEFEDFTEYDGRKESVSERSKKSLEMKTNWVDMPDICSDTFDKKAVLSSADVKHEIPNEPWKSSKKNLLSGEVPQQEMGESSKSSKRNLPMRERPEKQSNWMNMPDLCSGAGGNAVLQKVNEASTSSGGLLSWIKTEVTDPDNENGNERPTSPCESLLSLGSSSGPTKETCPKLVLVDPLGQVKREKSPSPENKTKNENAANVSSSVTNKTSSSTQQNQKPFKTQAASPSTSKFNKESQQSSESLSHSNGEPQVQKSKQWLGILEDFLRSSHKFDEYLTEFAEQKKAEKAARKKARAAAYLSFQSSEK